MGEVRRMGRILMEPREYPDPAERYEELHREEREYEQDYDEYLGEDE